MTSNRSLFSSLVDSDGGSVRAAGGALYPILGKGICHVQVSPFRSLALQHVLYVPGLGDNLLSQLMLEDAGAAFRSQGGVMTISYQNSHMCIPRTLNSYRLLDHTKRVSVISSPSIPSIVISDALDLPRGDFGEGGSEELICSLKCASSTMKFESDILESLFSSPVFSIKAVDGLDNTLTRKDKVPEGRGRRAKGYTKPSLVALRRQDQGGEPESVRIWRLWHRRLGHPSDEKLAQLSRVVTGASIPPKPANLTDCLICQRAKANAGHHPASFARSEHSAGLVHIDTVGPLSVPGREGQRYILGIVDDSSRFATTYCIAIKSAGVQCIIDYCREREAQSRLVTHVRVDNAKELVSNVLIATLRSVGINVMAIPPYSQYLNGVAERFNGTLMGTVRAMLSDSELPLMFWADAATHATRIYNRRPHAFNSGKTPFEVYFSKLPSLHHYLIFGCLVNAYLPKEHRLSPKLSDRAFTGIYLGGQSYSGFDVYDPTNKKIFRVGNIRAFDELNSVGGTFFKLSETEKDINKLYIPDLNALPEENEEVLPPKTANPTEESTSSASPITLVHSVDVGQDPDSPEDIQAALSSRSASQWRHAIGAELAAHRENETWEVVKAPLGEKLLGFKWVFTTKRDEEGKFIKRKARLVAKGFAQRAGRDYYLTESPVADRSSLRTFVAVAAARGHIIRQLDVTAAYLHGDIDVAGIFMRVPEGLNVPVGHACRLKKGLYGLKQAGRIWFITLRNHLISSGWKNYSSDAVLFSFKECFLIGHVDDFMVSGPNDNLADEAIATLKVRFPVKDLGFISFILGVQVSAEDKGYSLGQAGYVSKLLSRRDERVKYRSTPLPVANYQDATAADKADSNCIFLQAVGELLFLTTWTRPDAAFSAGYLGRFSSSPTVDHEHLARHLLGYVAATAEARLNYPFTNGVINLEAYADSDWAGDRTCGNSTTGYVVLINGGAVLWRSAKQGSIAASVAEAELIALKEVVLQIRWLRALLADMGVAQQGPTPVYSDSKAALDMVTHFGQARATRHACVTLALVREAVEDGTVVLKKIATEKNVADIFTKPLVGPKIRAFSSQLGLSLPPSSLGE